MNTYDHATRPDHRRSVLRWGTIVVGAAVVALAPVIPEMVAEPTIIWATGGGLVALTIVLFRTARRAGDHPFLVPYSALPLFFGLAYGIGIVNTYYYDVYPWQYVPAMGNAFLKAKPTQASAALLLFAGVLGVTFGTLLSARPVAAILPAIRPRAEGAVFRSLLMLGLPIFVASTVLSVWSGTPTAVRQIFTLISDFGFLMLIAAGSDLARAPRSTLARWLPYVLIMLGAALLIGTPTGQRGHTLRPLILLGIGAVVALRRIPRVMWPGLALVVIVLLPWLNHVKVNARLASDLGELVAMSTEDFAQQSFGERLEASLNVFGNRVFGTPYHLAMYMQTWPDAEPFEYGYTLLLELREIVPRPLFPWKGELSGELNWYAVKAGVALEPDPETGAWTSATFDGLSEYYLNFGPWGVLLLGIVHGYYFLILHDWLVVRSQAGVPRLIYAYLVWFTWPDVGVIRRMASDVRAIGAWLLFYWVMTQQDQQQRARPAPGPDLQSAGRPA